MSELNYQMYKIQSNKLAQTVTVMMQVYSGCIRIYDDRNCTYGNKDNFTRSKLLYRTIIGGIDDYMKQKINGIPVERTPGKSVRNNPTRESSSGTVSDIYINKDPPPLVPHNIDADTNDDNNKDGHN